MEKWPRQCLAAGKVCRYGRPDSKRPEIHGIWNQAAICRLAIGNRRPSELSQSCRMPQAGDYRDRRKIMQTSLVLRRRGRRAFSSLRTTFSPVRCFTTWSQSSVTASPRLRTSCHRRSTKSLRGKLRRRAREYRHRQPEARQRHRRHSARKEYSFHGTRAFRCFRKHSTASGCASCWKRSSGLAGSPNHPTSNAA
jgi:hypothetical protein